MKIQRTLTLGLILAGTTLGFQTQQASAQNPPTSIVVPAAVFAQKADGFIDVLVSGWGCGEIYFGEGAVPADETGRRVFPLDLPTQFPACSVDGAPITLVGEDGGIVAGQFTVQTGEEVTVNSLTPESPTPGAATLLAVNRGVLDYTPDIITSLTVRAGEATCGTVNLRSPAETDADGNAILRLDGPGVAAACSVDGTTLTVQNNRGDTLFRHPVVVRGGRVMLAGLGPEAPGAEGPGTTPLPPNTGNGLQPSPGDSSAATAIQVAALAAFLLIAARLSGLARRRS